MTLTRAQFSAIMSRAPAAHAEKLLPLLVSAMEEADITTPRRQAAFLANLGHESGDLRYWEELADGKAYEGRRDLGNTSPGDGPRFKGRGPIQLTGRANYRAAGLALGLDLEAEPELVATPEVGFRVAGWFWTSRGINAMVDAGNFFKACVAINGLNRKTKQPNGIEDRRERYHRALVFLAPRKAGP